MDMAEKFAACMAEAGYPLQLVGVASNGRPRWAPHPMECMPEFWRAGYRAAELLGFTEVTMACRDCYVAHKQRHPERCGVPPSAYCEHVEAMA